jgi:hypothetical protein
MNPLPILTLIACGCVSLTPASMAEPQCHTNANYQVVMQPYPDDAGNRFAVMRLKGKAPAGCRFDEARADFTIGEEGDPLWFGELSGDSLILSRSTGPQGDLVVYDLKSGKPVLDVPSDEYELKGSNLSFWQRMEQANASNCPSFAENEANGMGSVIAARKTFDIASRAVAETGESKCVAVQ